MARPDKKVIAIDGDGALLMRMGCLAANGFYRPPNLLHVVLDNHCHDSTGGQHTVAENVRFAAVASHSGYPAAFEVHDLGEFTTAVRTWLQAGIDAAQLAHSQGVQGGTGPSRDQAG